MVINRYAENYNIGNNNNGDFNIGSHNTGDHNCGDHSLGSYNSGDFNIGDFNSGDNNVGDYNNGDYNLGDYNSGDNNMGDRNTGSYNNGYYNTGDYNSGNFNTGDFNMTDYSNGFFNDIEPPIYVFNKKVNMTRKDFLNIKGIIILKQRYKNNYWIKSEKMTEEEKQKHPEYTVLNGYLKILDFKEAFKKMWSNLTVEEKEEIKKIPNFDKNIFFRITEINVED